MTTTPQPDNLTVNKKSKTMKPETAPPPTQKLKKRKPGPEPHSLSHDERFGIDAGLISVALRGRGIFIEGPIDVPAAAAFEGRAEEREEQRE